MIGILFLWYCLCLHHDIRDFILHPHYLNGYLKHSGYSINTCWMHENNEWRVVSDWMDCYRHLAITALFLNESLASTPLYLTPPPNFSSPTCFPMDMFSIRQFHAWSGFLQPSHHIWIRDLSHSWVWSYSDSFLAMPVLFSFSPFVLAPSPPPFQTLCSFVYKCTSPNMPILPG